MFYHREPDANKIASHARRHGIKTILGKGNVWRFNKVFRKLSEKLHNAEKPLPMVVQAIQNSSESGDVVIDFFGGSGTTLIACEQTGRVCHMMEIDPDCCQTIIKRWEQETGGKARIISRC